jgi:hypothetical protein
MPNSKSPYHPLHPDSIARLKDLRVPYDTNSWQILSQKMDQLDNSQAFDHTLAEKVGQLESNQTPQWERLQSTLNLQERKVRQIHYGKILELCFLFLLATIWIQFDSELRNQKANQDITVAKHFWQWQEKTKTWSIVGGDKPLPELNENNQSASINVLNDTDTPSSSPKIPNYLQNEKRLPFNSKQGQKVVNRDNTLSSDDGIVIEAAFRENVYPVELLSSLEMIDITSPNSNPWIQAYLPRETSIYSDKKALVIVQKPAFSISLALGRDRDLIRTPYPTQQSVHHLGRIERNYHWELHALMQLGNIEYHTGIQIWQKNYSSVYQGANQAYMLSIPLGLKLYLSKEGTVRPYLLGGVSAHIVTRANYNDYEAVRSIAGEDFLQNNYQSRNPGVMSSDGFDNGILEGESFKGNHYFTATMGIGLDIPVHYQWSLFFEQIYTHHLQGGIGPAFDKFSSSSTNAGIKFHFRK